MHKNDTQCDGSSNRPVQQDRSLVPILSVHDEHSIFLAIDRGDLSLIKSLMAYGISIFSQDAFGNQLIHYATSHGREHVTIPFVSTSSGNPTIIAYLIECGADINALNHKGESPLKCALNTPCNAETIVCLLEHGAKLGTLQSDEIRRLLHFLKGYDPLLHRLLKILLSQVPNGEHFARLDQVLSEYFEEQKEKSEIARQKIYALCLSRMLMIASAYGNQELVDHIVHSYGTLLFLIPTENIIKIVLAAVRNGHKGVFNDLSRRLLVKHPASYLKELFHQVLLVAALSRQEVFLRDILSHQGAYLDSSRVYAILCEVKRVLFALEAMIAESSTQDAFFIEYRNYYRDYIVPVLEDFFMPCVSSDQENTSTQGNATSQVLEHDLSPAQVGTIQNNTAHQEHMRIDGSFISVATDASEY